MGASTGDLAGLLHTHVPVGDGTAPSTPAHPRHQRNASSVHDGDGVAVGMAMGGGGWGAYAVVRACVCVCVCALVSVCVFAGGLRSLRVCVCSSVRTYINRVGQIRISIIIGIIWYGIYAI
jgi:hypothetical protein